MENIKYTEISIDDFKRIESEIDSIMSEEELIKTHKKLIGISCKCDYWETKDCGIEFINTFLSRDWGRSIVYHYSQGAKKFIQSKYLSDYFKSSIKELLSNKELDSEVLNTLNSDKTINDMSEKELLSINSAIKNFYAKSSGTEEPNISNCLMSLLYKLDGPGVISFIKNNVNKRDLASHILLTSGLTDSGSYYSGRGVNYGDLNENNLVAIFSKLLKIDGDYATNFVEMVNKMKTLGATEFINTFMNFAINGFKVEALNLESNNVSLDEVYGEARDIIGLISIFSVMNKGNDQDYQIRASEQIKDSFMSKIKPILQSINPDCNTLDSQPTNSKYHLQKSKK